MRKPSENAERLSRVSDTLQDDGGCRAKPSLLVWPFQSNHMQVDVFPVEMREATGPQHPWPHEPPKVIYQRPSLGL